MTDDIRDEDRRRTAVHHGILWSWTMLEQAARIRTAQKALEATSGQRQVRYGQAERVPFLQLHAERHFFLNAARNLMRAVRLLERPDHAPKMVPAAMAKHLRILRDCFEHWDEAEHAGDDSSSRGRAFRDFEALKRTEGFEGLPEIPNSHQWGPLGTVIGGLKLEELEALAHGLQTYFFDLERTSFVWRGWTAVPDATI